MLFGWNSDLSRNPYTRDRRWPNHSDGGAQESALAVETEQ